MYTLNKHCIGTSEVVMQSYTVQIATCKICWDIRGGNGRAAVLHDETQYGLMADVMDLHQVISLFHQVCLSHRPVRSHF